MTSTTPTCSSTLIANAATIPRAPVIAFQPAIAAAREAIGVCSLTTAAIPTSIDAHRPRRRPGRATHRKATLGATA